MASTSVGGSLDRGRSAPRAAFVVGAAGRRRATLRGAFALCAAGWLAACGGREGPVAGPAVSVRDSAGVRLVENAAAVWGEGEGWRLAEEPRLTVGASGLPGDDAGADEILFQRVVGVQLLSDGRIAVLDAGDASVRMLDAEGRETERWGRFGEGPLEFQGPLALMRLPGDTLVVWDAPTTSLNRIVPGTGIVSRTPLTRIDGVQLRNPSMAADGRVLMPGFAWPAGTGEQDPGVYRGTAPVLVHAASGETVDTLALRPARQVMVAEMMGRSVVGDPPFSADLHAVWAGSGPSGLPVSDRVAVGDGLGLPVGDGRWQWQVEIVDSAGLSEVIRGPAEDLALTEADRNWYMEQLAERATTPQEEAMLAQMERSLLWPDARPAWNGIQRDDTGHLWLRIGRHLPPTAYSTRWRIVSPEGVWLGDLRLPDGFEPLHLGSEAVAGVLTDELGVQRVQVYRLERR